ncbi:UvrD-helicase domain-containing protein [Acinetobacter junii]|uniref:UvrD-helicase domain-containing protein n=1 Tax=Acinetobacter junii TaxID=40215 RepID=UPI00143B568A|nr:ATP-dependent helicase [Acinetobacter junii]NKG33858.1 DNA helicase UvrD [Acinetobacter junii]
MDQSITEIDKVKELIENNQLNNHNINHFVLQGGAGSGKTESLKEIIEFISNKYPNQKIACITHTNIAVEEIKSRINNDRLWVSTIHSFLNEQIKNFQKNLKEVLPNIFFLDDDVIENYDIYKKRYDKLLKLNYKLNKDKMPKVIGKRDYDKNSIEYNGLLISKIKEINSQVSKEILLKDFRDVRYNETVFDSIDDGTFSHDSLIKISYLLADKYSLLSKIISDKFDYIFIDEYQDTDKILVDFLLKKISLKNKTTIGFFGDSMQGIYEGVGDLKEYIEDFKLVYIPKDDNYRCSEQVVNFLNTIRSDDIKQKVALKKNESLESRQDGSVNIYVNKVVKISSNGSFEDKENYISLINNAIKNIRDRCDGVKFKTLQLTNKSIAMELKFSSLFKVFEDRFPNLDQNQIEINLRKIQIKDVVDLIVMFKNNEHNDLILKLKSSNLKIRKLVDKINIIKHLNYLSTNDLGLNDALEYCCENGLLIKSQRRIDFESQCVSHLESCVSDPIFMELKKLLEEEGLNTYIRAKKMCKHEIDEYDYNYFLSSYRKANFNNSLYSNDLKISEILNYFEYIDEKTISDEKYLTMHKTKGTGIDNVFVVLEEFFWGQYSFKSIYNPDSVTEKIRSKSEKIFYVACSRAIKNLIVLFNYENDNDLNLIKSKFNSFEIIDLNTRGDNMVGQ